jgi:folate-dependent phosphoribosylglycinamide formyltransferase PurN
LNDKRVVILVGSRLHNLNTLALFLEDKGINVVGACIADKRTKGIDFSYLRYSIKKEGACVVFSQIFQRILYKILNSRKDAQIHKRLFDKEKIESILSSWKGPVHYTDDFQKPITYNWIQSQSPDLIVVHTPYWVGKKIRNLVDNNIIGGHPGVTPLYRGIHSPFWALYNNDTENVGYSIFFLDAGVDTGDVIYQGKIDIEEGDSYVTLGWKGMVEIAKNQLKIVRNWTNGAEIPRKKHEIIPPDSNYSHPKLNDYIKYRIKKKNLR